MTKLYKMTKLLYEIIKICKLINNQNLDIKF